MRLQILALAFVALMAGCDATTSPADKSGLDFSDLAAQATLDSNLYEIASASPAPIALMANTVNINTKGGFFTPPDVEWTLLLDCVSRPYCQETDSGPLVVLTENSLFQERTSVYLPSLELDSALDTTLDKTTRIRCAQLVDKDLVQGRIRSWGPRPSGSSSEGEILNFGNKTRYIQVSSGYGRTESLTRTLEHSGTSTRWLQGRFSSNSENGILNWHSDSGLTMGQTLTGTALVIWSVPGADSIAAEQRFADGVSVLTNLAAKKVSGFDSLWLESPGKVRGTLNGDTSTLWLNNSDSWSGLDSMEIHRNHLGARWTDLTLRLSWDQPSINLFACPSIRLHLRGTLASGRLETIVATVKIVEHDDRKNTWMTFERSATSTSPLR